MTLPTVTVRLALPVMAGTIPGSSAREHGPAMTGEALPVRHLTQLLPGVAEHCRHGQIAPTSKRKRQGNPPMPSRRPARYELYIMVLLVLFWGCIGLNRVGIGFIFPIIVPEFHMQLWQAGLLISGTSHQLGVQQLDWRMAVGQPRPPRYPVAGRRIHRPGNCRDGRDLELPVDVRRP